MPDFIHQVGVLFQASIALLVVSVGMHATVGDFGLLVRRRGFVARSIIARNVIVPVAAVALIRILDVDAPLSAVLLALSISAIPPILPRALLRAGASRSDALGLVLSQSVLAIGLVPLSVALLNDVLGTRAQFSARQTATVVASVTIAPLLAGLVIRQLAPSFANRAARPLHNLAMLLLAVAVLGVLPHAWRAWGILVGNGTLLVIVLLTAAGIASGHMLGGPRDRDRTTLALASVATNPGLAMAILKANSIPHGDLAAAAVLLYLLVQGVVAWSYARVRRTPEVVGLYRIGERRRRPRFGPDRRRIVG